MKLPLSWLREYAPVEVSAEPSEVAERLTAAGLEVESVEQAGHDISGVIVAEVLSIEELTEFKKPIRYCRVATEEGGEPGGEGNFGVICGATNFTAGDRVPLAKPGAVLPGGFEIGERTTYGRVSQGMISSASELGIGDEHSGILVLPPDAPLGADFVSYAGLRNEVFDIAVTPNRGDCVSVRGVARELAIAFGVTFTDPADAGLPAHAGLGADLGWVSGDIRPASIADPTACDRFVLREVRDFRPGARTPLWMRVRLARSGVRTISLAVDVTNYLMLELGQPLHAFDGTKISGPIVVRRAGPGERLETLDHAVRDLDPDDIVIADDSGPISLAGTMGGLATEIDESSADLLIEAAHFSPSGVARMARRHRLHSEASYRFERGVDRELPLRASAKAAALLASLGGGKIVPGCTHAHVDVPPVVISMAADYPDRVAGVVYGLDAVIHRLRQTGCATEHDRAQQTLVVTPPSWRSDLTDPADLAEEVIRLEGYENIPVRRPRAFAGHGLTQRQRLRRSAGRGLADAGYVEVLSTPFVSAADADRLQLPPEDPRRDMLALANPLNDDEPLLQTTLLPGLFRVLNRNTGRGFADVALFEMSLVFLPRPGGRTVPPALPVDRAPAFEELAALQAALPDQPLHVAAVLAGERSRPAGGAPGAPSAGPTPSRPPARLAGSAGSRWTSAPTGRRPGTRAAAPRSSCRPATVRRRTSGSPGTRANWTRAWCRRSACRPGPARSSSTCPRSWPRRKVASGPVQAPVLSPYPPATQDVALIVDAAVPAAAVQAALRDGAATAAGGILLEDIRLFDVYTGAQAGEGRKSLAYTLRFRALDRTLTAAEATAARDAAVAEAEERVGATLRGG